jgi:hypothetical protein
MVGYDFRLHRTKLLRPSTGREAEPHFAESYFPFYKNQDLKYQLAVDMAPPKI